MTDLLDVAVLTARAEEDYLLTRSALRHKSPLTYGACYHAQQCAEKYIKAMLASRGVAFPRTHDLAALDDLCARAGIFLRIDQDLLDTLSAYAVRVRYSGDEPTTEEAHRAFKIAQTIRRFARQWLGVAKGTLVA